MAEKTKKMMMVEDALGKPLEEVLPDMLTELGLTKTADRLGISKATLGYWLSKKLGITVRRVALLRGEYLEVKRVG